jgi:hypothetical protein
MQAKVYSCALIRREATKKRERERVGTTMQRESQLEGVHKIKRELLALWR